MDKGVKVAVAASAAIDSDAFYVDYCIPVWADFMVAYSTVPGETAH